MALKVELKPGERIIVGDSIITNDNQRTRLFIEGQAPILREKDILTPATADSPAKRIYLAVQLMYLSKDIEKIEDNYFSLVNDIILAAPSTIPYITKISNSILAGAFYKALKEAKKLIEYERTLIGHVQAGSSSVPEDEPGSRLP
ncbi:flagellar biosynthesis repressor FlbT [Pannonibacter sp. Q-1]|jgi:flagellar protein FlbT|uniref:Flagellar biosynthesis repressor FlbT n=2 Tax=Pannonibacter TaxID=227873 RepID=A0A0U3PKT9_9HYPH|nr:MULTISPECIES: flagellar biosynthesis repressor FlbT [Pannonibacter]ALV28204.1 flagellar biosynthesis repressor FlbT [Pannonibacter phragmitetus]MBA4204012.1 flagellar biosynthesis repressor FlbT [Polymorphum sp.]CUA91778.1 Flagellar biosynthesis regulator FlbT [Pannonibacter indicus]